MIEKNKVLIIGGGAAGLMAAIAAAQNGAEVVVIERLNRVGKKILATGNGRCNLSNIHLDLQRFHGKNVKFTHGAFGQFDVQQTLDFFEYLGIYCKVEDGGKVYPFSDQASSVLDVLRFELERLGVKEQCDARVTKIIKGKKGFTLNLEDGKTIKGDKVIIATGGKASPNLGSDGSGYDLVTSLGHRLIEPFPALVQLKLSAHFLKALKGVKFIGKTTVGIGEQSLREEEGEILFTDYGISGPPILQLSRKAAEQLQNKRRPWLRVDLFPNLTMEQLEENVTIRLGYQPQKSLDFSFIGMLNKKLIPVLLKEAGVEDIKKPAYQLQKKEKQRILQLLKGWQFEVTGTQPWSNAQTTAGGIDVRDVDGKTMESKKVPGLYLAGEILDIDGDCGGFNLQWAWSSGYVAGTMAACSEK